MLLPPMTSSRPPAEPPAPPAAPTPVRDVFASVPRQDRHKPKGGAVRKSKASRWRAGVLFLVHLAIGIHVLQWFVSDSGKTLSPVEPSEAMQGLENGQINAGFVFFAAAILVTFLLGRWVCGWACHLVALQDLCAWLLERVGLRPRPVRSRLLIYGPFVVGGYMFVWPQIMHWFVPDAPQRVGMANWELSLYTDDLWRTFPGWVMAPLSILVVGFLIVWWLGAKGFCTHGCPYGAFFAIADRFAVGRIRVTDACEHCGHCTSVCTSNVRVHEEVAKHGMVVDPGCMKCMDCVSVCPKDALFFGVGAIKPFAVSQQRIAARADFGWGEEIALALLMIGSFYALRGAWFGESIPLLLAVGLGAITAVLGLVGWRLLRRPNVVFQHSVLKDAGRLTRRGKWVLGLVLLWGGFTVHTGFLHHAGEAAFRDAWELLRQQRATHAVTAGQFEAVEQRLAAVDRWSLLTPPIVLGAHGLVLREMIGRVPLDKHAPAIRQLERMNSHQRFDRARLPPADLALATYYLGLQRPQEAGALAQKVLEIMPEDLTAKAILQQAGIPK